ncbi:S53 family peptidase [Aspergillus candidus]|uniref:tripeptidyl-peptidase II n=1 Tax=Aspergillus candidus TaxID=41067 RepID=A0A2I2EZF3_ASPCN|nr:putative tripeptidyl-peptidase [Aspergillus candidus]PLB33746.1 putative tripeptidyl-peptidase [Aspergillus candidus]
MLSTLFGRGAATLAVYSLLAATVSAEAFEKLSAVPQGWRYSHHPAADEPLRLQIALAQGDPEGFEKVAMDMATPGHENYGKHFDSHDEMKRMLLPRDESVSVVRDWLSAAGIDNVQQDADWIKFSTSVSKANALLDASFQWYASATRDVRRLRTLRYSVPEAVAQHVNTIQPTTRFGQIRPNHSHLRAKPAEVDENFLAQMIVARNISHCSTVITPQCLQSLYNIGDYKADPKSGSEVGFSSYLEESARYDDLEMFQEKLLPDAVGQNFSVVLFNGANNDQTSKNDSGEANLDLQYIMGVSAPLPVTEFITSGRGPLVPDLSQPDPSDNQNEPYLEFLQEVLKQKKVPQVISTSYGENEQTVTEKYAHTVCDLYKQLGTRGVSVIFSSGDSGIGSSCQTNDGKNTTHFPPQFPAACPWVTSVGATHGMKPEEGSVFSSGGFSDLWKQPAWQKDAVDSFLDTIGDKYSKYFDRAGRAFPDVAAQGEAFAVYDQGRLAQFDGTSASSPAFAGIIGLLNDARLRAGQPVLGFLNPWLYSTGKDGFTDIVDGRSTGCDGKDRFGGPPNGSPVIPDAGWDAIKGWDPVTGLGTPNFGKLKELALKK